MTIIAIAGSPGARSRSTFLLRHASRQLETHGFAVSEIGLSSLPAEVLVQGQYMNAEAKALREQIAEADAVLIASPIYKASFSGGLKALLDLLDERALVDKLVLPIATGGSAAHLLAMEYGFKLVFSALGARHILAGVYATDKQVVLSDEGGDIHEDVDSRLTIAVNVIVEQLRRDRYKKNTEGVNLSWLVAAGKLGV